MSIPYYSLDMSAIVDNVGTELNPIAALSSLNLVRTARLSDVTL